MEFIRKKATNFSIKQLLLVYCLFVLVILLTFGLMCYQSIKKTENRLIENSMSQLNYLNDRLDNDFKSVQFSVAGVLKNDDIIRYQRNLETASVKDKISLKNTIVKQLQNSIGSSQNMGAVYVFWKDTDQMVSASTLDPDVQGEIHDFIYKKNVPGWYAFNQTYYYINFNPFIASKLPRENYQFVVAGKVRHDYMYNLLANISYEKGVKTFFTVDNGQTISIGSTPKAIQAKLKKIAKNDEEISQTVRAGKNKYHLLSIVNRRTNIRLTTYVDMGMLSGNMINTLFSSSLIIIVLTTFAIMIMLIFYFKIFKNLKILFEYIHTAEKGDYSARIPENSDKEFDFVFKKYNDMLDETENLMDSLKKETNLRETAEFRQLQSQINPHFFYNNLLFIMSMAETSPKAVTLMTSHLAEYYRYVTKKNTMDVTLEQELKFAENYLTIMGLRKEIDFFVDYPEELANVPFMQLIIQPIVENAIYHGIEEREGSHEVNISVETEGTGYSISIFDDGAGLTEDKIGLLQESINRTHPEKNGSVGLWNIQQRLVNRYGPQSSLQFQNYQQEERFGFTVSFWVPLNDIRGKNYARTNH